MREMIKLFAVITIFAAISGGVLATIRAATTDRIEYQQLVFVKGPAIKEILEGCSNDPLTDRFRLPDGEVEINFYVGAFDGKRNTVAFEAFGKGYGGDIGVMVGVNLENDQIVGVGVTTHSETPGLGARVKTEPTFGSQFKGKSITAPFQVKADGGDVDALSGATVSSRGVCGALTDLSKIYQRMKPDIKKKLQS